MEMRTQKQQLPDIGWKINKKLLHLGGKNIIGEVDIKAVTVACFKFHMRSNNILYSRNVIIIYVK